MWFGRFGNFIIILCFLSPLPLWSMWKIGVSLQRGNDILIGLHVALVFSLLDPRIYYLSKQIKEWMSFVLWMWVLDGSPRGYLFIYDGFFFFWLRSNMLLFGAILSLLLSWYSNFVSSLSVVVLFKTWLDPCGWWDPVGFFLYLSDSFMFFFADF